LSFLSNPPNEKHNPLPPLLQLPSGLAILELQGTINMPSSNLDNGTIPIGNLIFPDVVTGDDIKELKKVWLYIGKHQRLTGEVKKLPKPLGILRKVQSIPKGQEEELEIVDVIKYKILFSQRPEPVT